MFKFNFVTATAESTENDNIQHQDIKWCDAKEMFFEDSSPSTEYVSKSNACLRKTEIGNTTIKHFVPQEIINFITNSDASILQAEQEHSDLITAVYEGGLKLWNGTFDILEYLNAENVTLSNMNVLDLGCGNGLIGLYSLLNGAANVTFQDYVSMVVLLNSPMNSR